MEWFTGNISFSLKFFLNLKLAGSIVMKRFELEWISYVRTKEDIARFSV